MQKTTIEMQAKGLDYQALNASLRALGAAQVAVHGVMGQRYLGCGMAPVPKTVRHTGQRPGSVPQRRHDRGLRFGAGGHR